MNAVMTEKIGRALVQVKAFDGTSGKYAGWYHVGVMVNGRASWKQSGSFPSREAADKYVEAMRAKERAAEAKKMEERKMLAEAKAAFVNPYKVGDLLYYSWGYEQTNIEFAQVVAVGPRSVTIRQIKGESVGATGWASDNVRPVRDGFVSEPERKNLTFRLYGGKLHCSLPADDRHSWSACGERESFHRSWYA